MLQCVNAQFKIQINEQEKNTRNECGHKKTNKMQSKMQRKTESRKQKKKLQQKCQKSPLQMRLHKCFPPLHALLEMLNKLFS